MSALIGLCDVTDIHDAQTAPDPLGICIHCGLAGVEVSDWMDVASGAGDFTCVAQIPVERCVFCGVTQ